MIKLSFGGYIDSLGHYSVVEVSGDNIETVLKQAIEARQYLRKSKQLLKTSEVRGETGSLNLSVSKK